MLRVGEGFWSEIKEPFKFRFFVVVDYDGIRAVAFNMQDRQRVHQQDVENFEEGKLALSQWSEETMGVPVKQWKPINATYYYFGIQCSTPMCWNMIPLAEARFDSEGIASHAWGAEPFRVKCPECGLADQYSKHQVVLFSKFEPAPEFQTHPSFRQQ